MKTSLLLLIAVHLNATLFFVLAEPDSLLKEYINPWFLVLSEVLLVIGYMMKVRAKSAVECRVNAGAKLNGELVVSPSTRS